MKFRIVLLSILMSLSLAVPSNAVQMRAPIASAALGFKGTTAQCSATIYADASSDKISAEMTLWDGSTCLETWEQEGTDSIRFSETATVVRGKSYTLKVDATVNGKSIPIPPTTKTCM